MEIRVLGPVAVAEDAPGGDVREISRGDKAACSPELLDRLRAATMEWEAPAVHFGLMLSTNRLVDSRRIKETLLDAEPEAIGGEMEGAGLYTAATRRNAHWILVKAVCDHGSNKTDEAQTLAARNAARFVVSAIRQGLLDPAD